jgi:hypothetical protein
MTPSVGKYYFVDYKDNTAPEGSYSGIALCVKKYTHDGSGHVLADPLFEFEHPQNGKLVLSLFLAKEVIMEAK